MSLLVLTVHCHFGGRPLVLAQLDRLLAYFAQFRGVWFARHSELARCVSQTSINGTTRSGSPAASSDADDRSTSSDRSGRMSSSNKSERSKSDRDRDDRSLSRERSERSEHSDRAPGARASNPDIRSEEMAKHPAGSGTSSGGSGTETGH